MKNLKEYVDNNTVSLKGLDESIVDKLSNLEGRLINECCGMKCYDGDLKVYAADQISYFYSESEVVCQLTQGINVQGMININRQFNHSFKYTGNETPDSVHPLYFKECLPLEYMQKIGNSMARWNSNAALYKFVKKICEEHKLSCPVVLDKIGDKLQIFFISFDGTNGKEGSIKSSLINTVQMLNGLEEHKEVDWAQVLDVSVDNADDVYTFLVTVEVHKNKFI